MAVVANARLGMEMAGGSVWRPQYKIAEPNEVDFKRLELMPDKSVVKKIACIKNKEFHEVADPEFMIKNEFSCTAVQIAKGPYSGRGDNQTWFLSLFYEPKNRSKVLRAFKSLGYDIEQYDEVPVDPSTCLKEELLAVYNPGIMVTFNVAKYEVVESEGGLTLAKC
eukprot:gnl/TRDRNA2_/TRDRNA2_180914_c0_seq1.p1 gnl/TRDRNA2_/TRDRNA2_180914_c0~~gnl/TRDRNA2_/TRDRNA2_180914_c0_seq1.p1  ORF type:complete len:185 (-),score=53.29 gnl/TRDRNA2_/TRDRNA2_180914_c0_seq1:132-629(-)